MIMLLFPLWAAFSGLTIVCILQMNSIWQRKECSRALRDGERDREGDNLLLNKLWSEKVHEDKTKGGCEKEKEKEGCSDGLQGRLYLNSVVLWVDVLTCWSQFHISPDFIASASAFYDICRYPCVCVCVLANFKGLFQG